jgi:PAS domain S-box-containing protein
MNNVADAVIAMDRHGIIESFNWAAERSFGYTAGEVIGQNVKMLMPDPYAGEHDGYLSRYTETGVASIIGKPARDVIGRRKDGSICMLELAISETRIGDQPKFIGVARDITVRKDTEAQLRQAQKMEAVGQLTGGVAHDFNNLLAVVLGNLDLIADILDHNHPASELIEKAIGAAERGANLTQRLLAFSRKQALQPEIIDCGNIINSIEELLRRTLGETIDIETSTVSDLWLCAADPSQLENSLLNLAINARDSMPRGGKLTIEVANAQLDDDYAAAQADVEPGEYVMVAVSDTGVGIPPNLLGRVFDPFFTTKQVGQGSGLGLSMVYGFAKQSGGHTAVYSEFGEGTTVKLYLPCSHESRTSSPRDVQTHAEPTGRDETVLVVEDDPGVRTLTITLLGNLGYTVLEAGTAAAALAELERSSHIDLVLTDVVLPEGMNGRELADEVRRRRPDSRILYMSGYTENAIDHQQRLDPTANLIQKPFRKRDLATKVRQALDQE